MIDLAAHLGLELDLVRLRIFCQQRVEDRSAQKLICRIAEKPGQMVVHPHQLAVAVHCRNPDVGALPDHRQTPVPSAA